VQPLGLTPAGAALAITSRADDGWQKASMGSWFFYQPPPAGVSAFDYVEQKYFLFDIIKCFDPLA
jgi:hypothetical protein